MPFQREIHHRRSVRLPGYDYSRSGAYFVTICTWQRECVFGDIVDGVMQLNEAGLMVQQRWETLPQRYPETENDAFMIMPNHLHGIIVIKGSVGAIHELPLQDQTLTRREMLLPKVVGFFKMNSGKNINALRSTPGIPVWQRNYYEHVIRDERNLNAIREYIAGNPARWADVL